MSSSCAATWCASIGYVGNTSSHLSQTVDINTLPADDPNRINICGGNCGGPGGYNANYDRPYLGFAGVNLVLTKATPTTMDCRPLSGPLRGMASRWALRTPYSHAWDVIDAQLFNNLTNPQNPGYHTEHPASTAGR